VPTEEGHRLAREAAERALSLDPKLAIVQDQIGNIKRTIDFDWSGANDCYQQAIALEPGNPALLADAAAAATLLGRFNEGLRLIRRAVELDPLNGTMRAALGNLNIGWVLWTKQ